MEDVEGNSSSVSMWSGCVCTLVKELVVVEVKAESDVVCFVLICWLLPPLNRV